MRVSIILKTTVKQRNTEKGEVLRHHIVETKLSFVYYRKNDMTGRLFGTTRYLFGPEYCFVRNIQLRGNDLFSM